MPLHTWPTANCMLMIRRLLFAVVCGIREAFKVMRYHLTRLHSYSWKAGDHQHICIASRLLEADDFKEVCPVNKIKTPVWGDDRCETCDYLCIVDFATDTNGRKGIIIDL